MKAQKKRRSPFRMDAERRLATKTMPSSSTPLARELKRLAVLGAAHYVRGRSMPHDDKTKEPRFREALFVRDSYETRT
jgi:hypothetical protein